MTNREETDVRELIQLTRELHKRVNELQGEMPSTDLADEFVRRKIAAVEKHLTPVRR